MKTSTPDRVDSRNAAHAPTRGFGDFAAGFFFPGFFGVDFFEADFDFALSDFGFFFVAIRL